MITRIADVITPEEAAELDRGLAAAAFADGAATAGWHAQGVKNNRQLATGMEGHESLDRIVRLALMRNAMFQMAVQPRALRPVLFNRHEPGMNYGPHVDDAIMGPATGMGRAIRTDVAFTLFLSAPDSYAGGELVIDLGGAEQAFKLPARALIAYPAGSLHRVAAVASGVRLAAVGWIQSMIREPAHRAILLDLDLARREVFAREGKVPLFDRLSKAHGSLLRLWAEP